MRLKFITFDLENRTIEAIWDAPEYDHDGNLIEYTAVKCRNYSAAEKDEFIADVENAQAYASLIGWE